MVNRIFIKLIFRQLFSLIILTSICSSAISVSAQTRKIVSKTPPKPSASKIADKKNSKCNGGWSGTITFSRRLDESDSSDEPGIRNAKDRVIHKWSHNVNYTGRVTIDGSVNALAPKAFGSVEFGETRRQQSTTKVWDSCKAVNDQHYMIDENIREDIETGNGAGETETFSLNVDELGGTYGFSFRFADVPGSASVEDHTTASGHCSAKNNQPSDLSEKRATKITGEGAVIENQKFDPQNPNVLTGTTTLDTNDYSDPKHIKVPITVINWKFRRCAAPLMITDLKFSQPQFPSPNSFIEIGENGYAIDGNQVKITATVVNLSGERKTASVNFRELTENTVLPDGNKTESFEPHEEREVELVWDTSGYAWKKDAPYNTAVNSRDIEVSIPDDRMHEQISVYPKPVVIVPGMWSKREKLEKFVSLFKNQNVPWAATIARTYVRKKSADNAPIIDQTVREIQKQTNAWHVDMVAHSTGGLAARAYINSEMPTQFDNFPTVKNLIMLGTPNLGTPCAAGVDNIITKFFNRSPEIFSEISHKNIQAFNSVVTNTHGTKFLAIAANTISPVCQLEETGDGVVPFLSATYGSKSYVTTNVPHEDLGGDQTIFTQIKKWLALSPKESATAQNSSPNFNPKSDGLNELAELNFGRSRYYGAMFHAANFIENNVNINSDSNADEPEPNFAIGVKLAANETKEIEIPMTNGSRLSLVLYAVPDVSAILLDEKGETIGRNLAGTPESAAAFRTITVRKPFQNGKWKLRLESRASEETEVAVTEFIDYSSNIYATK